MYEIWYAFYIYSLSQFALATFQVLNSHMACGSIPDNTVLESDPNAQIPWLRIIESELEVNREIKPLVTEEETEAHTECLNGLLEVTQVNLG